MIYTVTFNPSLDYVIAVSDFDKGKINKTTAEDIFADGKGINVSIMLSILGINSTALGFVAGSTTYFGSIDLIENTMINYNNTYKN